jgi:surfeit locus 1 family protein
VITAYFPIAAVENEITMTLLASRKIKKIPAVAFTLLLPLLLGLGIWQLGRAQDKQHLLDMQTSRQMEKPILMTMESPSQFTEDLLYKPVRVIGRFDEEHQILQNNQIQGGKAGFFVLTPFLIGNGKKAILVNRGWLSEKAEQTVLSMNLPNQSLEIKGTMNHFSRPGIVLPGADKPTQDWPTSVQVVNTAEIGGRLGYQLFDYQIELDASYAFGFSRNWQHPLTMPPEKHHAYAVQWFLLALTLTVLFIRYGFEKNNG